MATTNLQKGFTDELVLISARSALGAVAGENFETATMDRLGKTANFPLRMFATFPTPNAVLNFEASNLEQGSGVGRSVPPIESVVPTVVASTLNFQTGSTTGATFTVESGAFALPSTTVGQFRRLVFVLTSSGTIDMKFSAANAVLASLQNPGALFDGLTGIPIGWIDLEATAATAYKTAGSATSIIENKVSGTSRINIFGQLVAASGSGKGTISRVIQAAHGFTVGKLLYLNGSTYTLGLATSLPASQIVGMVSRVVDANTFEITLSGEVTGLTGLITGTTYFLSDTVAGNYSATEPSILGEMSVLIGVASSATNMFIGIDRPILLGTVNARTVVGLTNNTTTTVQSVAVYDSGTLDGWIYINAATPLRFAVRAQFAKNGAGTDYVISPQYMGDTPPVGFDLIITSAGLVRITLPSIPGFVSAQINYALNAAAIGTTFPLTVDSTAVQFSIIKAKDVSGMTLQNVAGTQLGTISDTGVATFGQNSSTDRNLVVNGTAASAAAHLGGGGLVPVGSIVAYNPGYYTNGSNGGFTTTGPAGNTEAQINAFLNASGWYVCNGAALNNAASPIWNAGSRFLPAINDGRFLRGSATAGTIGGNSAQPILAAYIPQVSTSYTPAGTVDIGHTHAASSISGTANSGVNLTHGHTNTATQLSNSAIPVENVGSGNNNRIATSAIEAAGTGYVIRQWTFPNNGHNHFITVAIDPSGSLDHSHSVTGTADGQGLGSTPVALSGTPATITVGSGSPTSMPIIPTYLATYFIVRAF